MALPDEDLAALGIRTDEYQRARAFVGLLKAATNEQLREWSREYQKPGAPLWKLAAVQDEMGHRGI
jgi:hypothetical protein